MTTSEASITPSASIPIVTWPREMLSKVDTRVAEPIRKGMGGDPIDSGGRAAL